MKQATKIILGIGTLWAVLYEGALLYWFAVCAPTAARKLLAFSVSGKLLLMVALHGITGIIVIWLITVYLFDMVKNRRVSGTRRLLWSLGLFVPGVFVMPFYWFFYIWCDGREGRKK